MPRFPYKSCLIDIECFQRCAKDIVSSTTSIEHRARMIRRARKHREENPNGYHLLSTMVYIQALGRVIQAETLEAQDREIDSLFATLQPWLEAQEEKDKQPPND